MLVPDVAHLAGADQVVERAQRLVDRHGRLRAVDLVEVDIVGLQAAQRGLALGDDVAAIVAGGQDVVVVHAAVYLGRQHDPVALAVALERLADDLLAAATIVDVGRIQKVDPRSSARSMMAIDSSSGVGTPKFIQPRQSMLTGTPVRPRLRYSIVASFYFMIG